MKMKWFFAITCFGSLITLCFYSLGVAGAYKMCNDWFETKYPLLFLLIFALGLIGLVYTNVSYAYANNEVEIDDDEEEYEDEDATEAEIEYEEEDEKCKNCLDGSGPHSFKPRFEKVVPSPEELKLDFKTIDTSEVVEIVNAFSTEKYILDICEYCGKVVTRLKQDE